MCSNTSVVYEKDTNHYITFPRHQKSMKKHTYFDEGGATPPWRKGPRDLRDVRDVPVFYNMNSLYIRVSLNAIDNELKAS